MANKKIFVIGLGKGAVTAAASNLTGILNYPVDPNTSHTRGINFETSYVVAEDTNPTAAEDGALHTIESEPWADIQAEIESIYATDSDGTVDIFQGTGYGNVVPHINQLKTAYPESTILLVYNANRIQSKIDDTQTQYSTYFPNLSASKINIDNIISTNGLVKESYMSSNKPLELYTVQ